MVSPLGVQVNPRQTTVTQESPFSVVILLPKEAGVAAPANTVTNISSDAIAASQLGGNTKYGRQWYNLIESGANVHIAALPFTPGADQAAHETNAVTALDALTDSDELAKITGANVDIILAPDYTGRESDASPIVTKLEQLCADTALGAIAIGDAYLSTSDQTYVMAYLTNNAGPNYLPITNGLPVGGGASVRGAAASAYHICHYAAQRGIGVHPFTLTDPVIGGGTPAPQRVLNLNDGSSAAEIIKQAYGTSFIVHDGSEYLWGGKLKPAQAGDPREDFANAMVCHRMVKRGRDRLAFTLGRRATEFLLADAALAVELALAAEFSDFIQSIAVGAPTLTGSRLEVPVSVGFPEFVESASLVVDIFVSRP